MAAIVNDRDVLLQAASPRILPITLPGNVSVPPGNIAPGQIPVGVTVPNGSVLGLGQLALQNTVNGSTQVTNLGLLAFANTLYANQLGSGTFPVGCIYAGTVLLSQLGSGTLPVGVAYVGNLSAAQILTGTMVADRIFGGTLNGAQLKVGAEGSTNYFYVNSDGFAACYNADIRALTMGVGDTGGPPPASGKPGIRLYNGRTLITEGMVDFRGRQQNDAVTLTVRGQGASTNNHAMRAFYQQTDAVAIKASGLVGVTSGLAFYAETYQGASGYGPFTGAHDALIPKGVHVDEGMVLEDVRAIATDKLSDTLFEVIPCSTARSSRRAGVFVSRMPLAEFVPSALSQGLDAKNHPIPPNNWDELCEQYDLIIMNALGEGLIKVCGLAGDIEAGDYVTTSNMRGVAQAQGDDVLHAHTVAKVRESVTFSHPEEVRLVPCYYHCG